MKYTPVLDGNARNRRCTVPACANTSSTRQVPGQLTKMARGEHTGSDGDHPGDRRRAELGNGRGAAGWRGRRVRLRGQRDLWVCGEDREGSNRPTRGPVAFLITTP